jgi:tetratricopeptide (TPR) repeat protein
MAGRYVIKSLLAGFSCFLMLHGYLHYKKCAAMKHLDSEIKMGRYQSAVATVRELEDSLLYKTIGKFGKDDSLISYNKGVLFTLMEERKKAGNEFRKAMETDDPAVKAKAIYNNANLFATDMDFSTAAMQYVEALKIDPDDFQAKKNLERMRIGETQFNTMFTPEQQEREDRIEALKLIPWGTKYKYSGEQKIRW